MTTMVIGTKLIELAHEYTKAYRKYRGFIEHHRQLYSYFSEKHATKYVVYDRIYNLFREYIINKNINQLSQAQHMCIGFIAEKFPMQTRTESDDFVSNGCIHTFQVVEVPDSIMTPIIQKIADLTKDVPDTTSMTRLLHHFDEKMKNEDKMK